MSLFNDPNRIHVNYGLRIAGSLVLYFVVMRVLNLHHIVELRLFNLFILVGGVYFALRKYKTTHTEFSYFRALVVGVGTAAVGSLIFSGALFIYVSFIDTELMQSIIENEPMGRFLNPYIVSFIVALEGVFSGLLVTFILINFISTDGE